MNGEAEGNRDKFVLKPKAFERVNEPLPQEASPAIEVRKILQDNLTSREAVAPLVLDLERKWSKRKRDYIFLLLVGNALIFILARFLPADPLMRVLGWSALGLYSVTLTWLMWGVMDDY